MSENPMRIMPTSDASHLPILCPRGPKRFVPIRYEMEAGRNAAPSCHLGASIRSIMKSGSEGSSMPIPMFEKVIAPERNEENDSYYKKPISHRQSNDT
jgi:hypothetical protein